MANATKFRNKCDERLGGIKASLEPSHMMNLDYCMAGHWDMIGLIAGGSVDNSSMWDVIYGKIRKDVYFLLICRFIYREDFIIE